MRNGALARMDRDRIALLLALAGLIAAGPACMVPYHVREPGQGTLTWTADGHPVPNARSPLSLPFFPAVELNARWLRPWRIDTAGGAEYGPELAVDASIFRFSVSALSRGLATAPDHRHFLFGAGIGFL